MQTDQFLTYHAGIRSATLLFDAAVVFPPSLQLAPADAVQSYDSRGQAPQRKQRTVNVPAHEADPVEVHDLELNGKTKSLAGNSSATSAIPIMVTARLTFFMMRCLSEEEAVE